MRGVVAAQGADKERFNQLAEELSQLSTKFSNNVLDATKAFRKLVTDKDVVAGLPPSALALAAAAGAHDARGLLGRLRCDAQLRPQAPEALHRSD